jgi:hypothetical protein
MRLTKIDVAEAHLITAVRAHFRGEHPASVYLLAASAREILTTIGEKTGRQTMLASIAQRTGTPLKKLTGIAGEFVNFFKHADRDPAAKLEAFTQHDAEMVLYIACFDFMRIAKGQAIELQVYGAWYFATAFPQVIPRPSLHRGPVGFQRHQVVADGSNLLDQVLAGRIIPAVNGVRVVGHLLESNAPTGGRAVNE